MKNAKFIKMKKRLFKDKYTLHLFILFVGLSIIAWLFTFFRFNTVAQTVLAFLGSIYYIVWGVFHHAAKKRIDKLIVLEYILVGSLIFLLLFISLIV